VADRNRCHCGAIPVTIDGFCPTHKHQSSTVNRDTLADELGRCKNARHMLNEDLIRANAELKVHKIRAQHLEKLLMRVKLGDIKIEEIDRWM
jgi:hypothetical protein